jgi:excisionase family DNA binding protein
LPVLPKYEVELSEDFLEAVAVRAAEIIEARKSHWLYGDKAAAEYLGWPTGRVTKLRQRGELPAYSSGQRYSFHTAELDAYLRGSSAENLPTKRIGPKIESVNANAPRAAVTAEGLDTGGKSYVR